MKDRLELCSQKNHMTAGTQEKPTTDSMNKLAICSSACKRTVNSAGRIPGTRRYDSGSCV